MKNIVELSDMLEAREKRVTKQQQLIQEYNCPLICFTMNIAGPVKTSDLITKGFDIGIGKIRQQLEWNCLEIQKEEVYYKETGNEYFAVVPCDGNFMKSLMIMIEESFPMGRIYDIDVLLTSGEKVSRSQIGMLERRCLLCSNQAAACGRNRSHEVEALFDKTNEIIWDYLTHEYADQIAYKACKALLFEVEITPKPGLVDRDNSGAHKDMDIFTFTESAAKLVPYFRDCVVCGVGGKGKGIEVLFAEIRYLGRQAEVLMYEATKGVNTHKGLVFSMGILCGAMGYLYESGKKVELTDIIEICKEMLKDIEEDFSNITMENAVTHGELLFARYGIKGIRGEAAAGFLSVINYGLPVLKEELGNGSTWNDAGIITLLHLMRYVEDTNVIIRSGKRRQEVLKNQVMEILKTPGWDILELVQKLDRELIQEYISPGGCADLLALTFFLYFVEIE